MRVLLMAFSHCALFFSLARGLATEYPRYVYKTRTYTSIRQVDFKNLTLYGVDGGRKFTSHFVQLQGGKYEMHGEHGCGEDVEIESTHYIGQRHALVIISCVSWCGSSTSSAVAQVFEVSDHRLMVTQSIDWDDDGVDPPFYFFDEGTNALETRAAHCLPTDGHHCQSAVDISTFRWDGSRFVRTGVRTELSDYGRSRGAIPFAVAYCGGPSRQCHIAATNCYFRVEPGSEGYLNVASGNGEHTEVLFAPLRDGKVYFDNTLEIPYDEITAIEYGGHPSCKSGATPKTSDYLSFKFTDDRGKQQKAVFELPNKFMNTTLAALARESGKPILRGADEEYANVDQLTASDRVISDFEKRLQSVVRRRGFLPVGQSWVFDADAQGNKLLIQLAVRNHSVDNHWQKLFTSLNGRFLGTDTYYPSWEILWVAQDSLGQFSVRYLSDRSRKVRHQHLSPWRNFRVVYTWDGIKLTGSRPEY